MSIIEVKSISKKYTLVHQDEKYLTLRDKIAGVISHPVKTISEIRKQKQEEFWALKDISFNVEQGEVIGIIGANGAGKSTLLKILSQITPPTAGEIKIKGKVASLLEVGTGFHPELTGRENIFLNGAILGMAKKEIEKKFNEIVEFSGIEKFLDTPVKRYSSGMYVRLAFSVAAHMEPDILLIDEVLAVGDAEFQKKCLGKMDEVTKKAGRTILFVSHNMGAVRSLCKRCVLLESGKIKEIAETKKIVDIYLNNYPNGKNEKITPARHLKGSGEMRVDQAELKNSNNRLGNSFLINEPFKIFIKIINKAGKIEGAHLFFLVYDCYGKAIFSSFQKDTDKKSFNFSESDEFVSIEVNQNIFLPGKYYISIGIFDKYNHFLDWVEKIAFFDISDQFLGGKPFDGRLGLVSLPLRWEKIYGAKQT